MLMLFINGAHERCCRRTSYGVLGLLLLGQLGLTALVHARQAALQWADRRAQQQQQQLQARRAASTSSSAPPRGAGVLSGGLIPTPTDGHAFLLPEAQQPEDEGSGRGGGGGGSSSSSEYASMQGWTRVEGADRASLESQPPAGTWFNTPPHPQHHHQQQQQPGAALHGCHGCAACVCAAKLLRTPRR